MAVLGGQFWGQLFWAPKRGVFRGGNAPVLQICARKPQQGAQIGEFEPSKAHLGRFPGLNCPPQARPVSRSRTDPPAAGELIHLAGAPLTGHHRFWDPLVVGNQTELVKLFRLTNRLFGHGSNRAIPTFGRTWLFPSQQKSWGRGSSNQAAGFSCLER